MDRLTGNKAVEVETNIRAAQKENGSNEIQAMIDSGLAWKMEGSIGRQAMSLLEGGVCFLPTARHPDAYGNTVPSRDDLQPGTKGTLELSCNHYDSI